MNDESITATGGTVTTTPDATWSQGVPDSISGLYAWFDGNDNTYITKDGDNRVSKWSNKEGTTARDLVETTSSNQPLWVEGVKNNRNMIDFDTTSKWMNTATALTAISQPMTVFMVALYPDDYSVYRTMWSRSNLSSDTYRIMHGGTTTTDQWRINAGSTLSVTDSGIGGNYIYSTAIFNTTSSDLRVNGVSKVTGNAGSNTYQGIGVGHNGNEDGNSWGSKIAEIIFYDKLLSTSEIESVESYLKSKWGL